MSQLNLEIPNTFGLLMAVQLLALVSALAGIYFLDVPVTLLGHSAFIALAIGVAGAILSYLTALWLTRSHTRIGETLRRHCEDLRQLLAPYSSVQIVLISLVAGICEELLFRGFLQTWLSRLSTPLLGLIGASVAFALLHYASFTYFIAALAAGFLLGLTYRITDSLLCVVIWHAVYDFLAITALARYPKMLR